MHILEKLHTSQTSGSTQRAKFEIANREKEAQDTYLKRLAMLQKFTVKHVQNTPTQELAVAYVSDDEFHIPQLETDTQV